MTEQAKKIAEKLNIAVIHQEDLDTILKDRLDFGFDSIYFRYATLCDELAMCRAQLKLTDPLKERQHMDCHKQHFYEALEQLLQAHKEVVK